jgi:hypothetical protein
MTEFDPERFEADLQTLRPASPPQKALNRLRAELSARSARHSLPPTNRKSGPSWLGLLRWLAPAAAAVAVAVVLLQEHGSQPQIQPQLHPRMASTRPSLKADQVEIDRQLIANFDAVARLPTGEPMRFRCQQWIDKVALRDSADGLVIQRTTPRLEIVPVNFETY